MASSVPDVALGPNPPDRSVFGVFAVRKGGKGVDKFGAGGRRDPPNRPSLQAVIPAPVFGRDPNLGGGGQANEIGVPIMLRGKPGRRGTGPVGKFISGVGWRAP